MHITVCRTALVFAVLLFGVPSLAAYSPRPSIRVKVINVDDPAATATTPKPVPETAAGTAKPAAEPIDGEPKPINVKTPPVKTLQANTGTTGETTHTDPIPVPKPPKQVWNATGGSTLRGTMETWSSRAGWTLRWEADDLNYPIDVAFQIEGQFTDVVSTTFDLYKTARRPFRVTLYAPQHLMVVTEQK